MKGRGRRYGLAAVAERLGARKALKLAANASGNSAVMPCKPVGITGGFATISDKSAYNVDILE
jgi:hypothetical protein